MPPEEGQPSVEPRTSLASIALALASMALAVTSMLSFAGCAPTLKLMGVDVRLADPLIGVTSSAALLVLAVLIRRVAGRFGTARRRVPEGEGGGEGSSRVEEAIAGVRELLVEVKELCRGLQRSLEELKAEVEELAEGVRAAAHVRGGVERSRSSLEAGEGALKVGEGKVDVGGPSLNASLILETLNALHREVKELRDRASKAR
ncbi:hypothetical protein B6U99_07255 [Candidatus Geothermarchaeota archaeon ex4572_27]|nr:MAG: hypothetical protein B6U99_07255 [Candidatus Geothermarchaeota archaeon ex4572_27]